MLFGDFLELWLQLFFHLGVGLFQLFYVIDYFIPETFVLNRVPYCILNIGFQLCYAIDLIGQKFEIVYRMKLNF